MKRGYVDTPDGQIHYRVTGEGDPVIILHPTPMSSRAMSPLIEAIAARGMRAIGMDTMGYGESDRPPTPYTTMSEYARSVAWLIQGLGLDRASLVGVLTGSQIALQTAAEYRELVRAVVTQEAFNWGTPGRLAVHERIHAYHPRRADGGHLLELWERSGWGSDLRNQDLNTRDFIYVNDDTGAEVYGHMGWEGAAPYSMCRTVMWDITPKIQAPVFITYRVNSELHRALERFLETLPHGKGLRDAPTFATDPDGFAEITVEFLKDPRV